MKTKRRYDIDWIRVIVFDILIFYHVGMFFVGWDFHFTNNDLAPWLKYPMILVNQWRLPILFVVSGMGTRFALSHRSGPTYIKERLTRILIPLLVGMFFIVPPQVYLERLVTGAFAGNYLQFYPYYFDGIYPKGNFSWHHLWFLTYLLFMSILATPLFLSLRKEGNRFIEGIKNILTKKPFGLYLFVLPLLLIEWTMASHFPVTRAFVGDWYALAFYFVCFISGYILISIGEAFWNAVEKVKTISLIIGIGCLSFLLINMETKMDLYAYPILKTLNTWSWILAIFGYAAKYLNHESELIKYRNQAVYPFYILHQTILLIIGYFLMNSPMHYAWKILIMAAGTFIISWILYEFLIKKINIIRPLFGLKSISENKIESHKTLV